MTQTNTIQSLVVMCRRLDYRHGGAALRNWQNVQALAELGPVDVVSVGSDDQPAFVTGVRTYQSFSRDNLRAGKGLLDYLIRKRWIISASAHPMLDTHYDTSVARWIHQRIKQYFYNLVVVEELALARYVSTFESQVGVTIFDAHNVESDLHRSITATSVKTASDGPVRRWRRSHLDRRLVTAERYYARRFDRIWTCSSIDQAGFRKLIDESVPVDVIPNAIDVSAYRQPQRTDVSGEWGRHPVTLVYLGSYSYYPNEEAALLLIRDVLPIIRSMGVKARVILIGSNPTGSMRLAAGTDDDIIITGKVDSIQDYLTEPCVVTIPLKLGSGTRLKILEAFASSRPVISTSKGSEGIEAEDGRHLLIRESAVEIAHAVIELWRNQELRVALCDNALELVIRRYSRESTSKLIRDSVAIASISATQRRVNYLKILSQTGAGVEI